MNKLNKNSRIDIQNRLDQTARDIWLLSLGAISKTEEESSKWLNKLKDAGSEIQEAGEDKIIDFIDNAINTVMQAESTISQSIEKKVEDVINKAGYPTDSQIKRMSEKLDKLSLILENLRKNRDID